MKKILIKNKCIDNDRTFIVAEIGANHNNDFELIKKTIKVAAECGVDAVKFQTYTSEELLADVDRIVQYTSNGKVINEPIGKMFDRLSLEKEWHKELFDYAKSLGLIAFSTPFSLDAARFLNSLNVPCFKVAASDVNYVDLLEELTKYNKPVMLSIGKCTLGEADQAINILLENGCNDIIIMHCVSQYPSPIEEMNLNTIKALIQLYPECIVGFSDHSLGITASLGAVAFGARVIEKHFTLDKTLEGPDHWFSMDGNDMKKLVKEVRNLEKAFGESRKRILSCEKDERYKSIRSLVLNKDKKKGDKINEEDIKMVRPGYGISPFDKKKILGMELKLDLTKNTVLLWEHFK